MITCCEVQKGITVVTYKCDCPYCYGSIAAAQQSFLIKTPGRGCYEEQNCRNTLLDAITWGWKIIQEPGNPPACCSDMIHFAPGHLH